MPYEPDQSHWYTGLQSALVAKWAIASAAISGVLTEAFLQGSFATPHLTLTYFQLNWWTLLISGLFGSVVGGGVRANQRVLFEKNGGTPSPPPSQRNE